MVDSQRSPPLAQAQGTRRAHQHDGPRHRGPGELPTRALIKCIWLFVQSPNCTNFQPFPDSAVTACQSADLPFPTSDRPDSLGDNPGGEHKNAGSERSPPAHAGGHQSNAGSRLYPTGHPGPGRRGLGTPGERWPPAPLLRPLHQLRAGSSSDGRPTSGPSWSRNHAPGAGSPGKTERPMCETGTNPETNV